FLVVGLEIKREVVTGERRQRGRASVPVIAAVGGMLVPAGVYLAITWGSAASDGFGIAVPTDIVFVLAVLSLARTAPPGLKAVLLALAIGDDLGSIGCVAAFSSEGVEAAALVSGLAIFIAYALFWRMGVRAVVVYVALGVAAWVALDASGGSPTIAGVVLDFLPRAVYV